MRRLVKNILSSVYIFFLGSLVASYLSYYISPETFWPLSFFGLFYPVILLINSLFVLFYLLIKKWKFAIAGLLIIIIGFNHFNRTFQFGFKNEAPAESFKVMSFNVRAFDLYNWSKNKETRDKIFEVIRKEKPDILCLQEFYLDKTKSFRTLDTLIKFLDTKNYHEEYTSKLQKKYFFGIASFFKYPIINKGSFMFKGTDNLAIYTDILVNSDTVRVYNCHLQSVKLNEEHYKFLDSIKLAFNQKQYDGAKGIIKKLRTAYLKRAKQADTISAHIQQTPYKVIVCGDFNDTPLSYTYRKMRGNLEDAFVSAGSGFGQSYSGRFPSFRIDYIFYDKSYDAFDFKTGSQELSDHYPVGVSLCKKK